MHGPCKHKAVTVESAFPQINCPAVCSHHMSSMLLQGEGRLKVNVWLLGN